jgi:regulatory protein
MPEPNLITALARIPRRKRLAVHVDGSAALTVTPEIAVQFGLRTGLTLTPARLAELRAAQEREDAMAAALRLLAYRPRSEKELRDRLRKRGIADEMAVATIARLKEMRLIDDSAFAASWVENREYSSPRSRRFLASELRLKGVSQAIAEASAVTVDEAVAAHRAGARKARLLANRPFDEFQRKLGDLLLRRGFGYETARETVRRLWQETTSDDPSGAADIT